MACLSGGESRRWTVSELVERFKNLGVLRLSGWAPWRLLERGTEWILEPKSELVALLSGVRRLPLKEAKILSEEQSPVSGPWGNPPVAPSSRTYPSTTFESSGTIWLEGSAA